MDGTALNFAFHWDINAFQLCYYGECMIPRGANVIEHALVDDRSCYFIGCADEFALNFNQYDYDLSVNTNSDPSTDDIDYRDDGTCIYELKGCTDLQAYNYNVNATSNDGSCRYRRQGVKTKTPKNLTRGRTK